MRSASGGASTAPILGTTRLGEWSLWAVALVLITLAITAPMSVLLRYLQDDGFYYIGIALRWVRGFTSSFDGIQQTNGYHPLWQWLLLPAAAVFDDPGRLARFAMALGVVLLAAAGLLAKRLLVARGWRHADLAPLWLACALLPAAVYGMETALAAFLLIACAACWPRAGEGWTVRRGLLCGAMSGLLFLSRLDTLPYLIALAGCAWSAARQQTRRVGLGVTLLIALQSLVVGLYLFVNHRLWGHWLPVSALAKAGRTQPFSLDIPLSALLPVGLFCCLLSVVVLVGALRPAGREEGERRWVPVWFSLGNLGSLALIVYRGGPETYGWYFGVMVVTGTILLPVTVQQLEPWVPSWTIRRLPAAGCLLVLLFLSYAGLTKSTFENQYRLARDLAQLPTDSIVFMATDCGILGSVSRQHCLNLDGLTSSFDFQHAIGQGRLAAWLRERGVDSVPTLPSSSPSKNPLRPVPGASDSRLGVVYRPPPNMHGERDAVLVTVAPVPRLTMPNCWVYQVLEILPVSPDS